MHPNNPFIADYDFDRLIQAYTPLGNFVFVNQYGNQTIKFADRQAVKALNRALLKSYYGIAWDIPADNLCPPIPGRLDYLLYVADMLKKQDIRLLDIGTGANLIYPILATCQLHWQCVGSEVDMKSLKNAQQIIQQNPVLHSVALRRQESKHHILTNIIQPEDFFDVVVCNPPFFKNAQEAQKKNQQKNRNLQLKGNRNFGGLSNELWFKGGEEAFVKKMALESVQFKAQVHWFTSLVAKKESLKGVQKAIKKVSPRQIKLVDMSQGNKKSRFVAWTFFG